MYKLNVAESLSFFARWIKKLFWLNFVFIVLLCFFRIAAWLYFGPSQNIEGHFTEILDALLLGARFDLSLLSLLTLLPLLYLFWVTLRRSERSLENYGQVVRPYFLLTFLLVSLFMVLDFSYFGYLKEHLDLAWLEGLANDPQTELERLAELNTPLFYVGLVGGGLIYIWVVFAFSKSLLKSFRLKQSFISKSSFNYVPAFFLSLALLALGAWGSFHEERLTPSEATFSRNTFVNYLAGNSLLFLLQDYQAPKAAIESNEPNSSRNSNPEQNYEFLEFNPTKDQQ